MDTYEEKTDAFTRTFSKTFKKSGVSFELDGPKNLESDSALGIPVWSVMFEELLSLFKILRGSLLLPSWIMIKLNRVKSNFSFIEICTCTSMSSSTYVQSMIIYY